MTQQPPAMRHKRFDPICVAFLGALFIGSGSLAHASELRDGGPPKEPAIAPRQPAAPRDSIVRDWMLQDYMRIVLPPNLERAKTLWQEQYLTEPESRWDAPVLDRLTCFLRPDSSVVERRMVEHVLNELAEQAEPFRAELKSVLRENTPGSDPRWKTLYLQACQCRRELRMQPLLARWNRFVFNQHRHIPKTWKYTEGLTCAQSNRFFQPGASVQVLQLDGPYGIVNTLLADSDGMLRNPDVSYDGQRLLFAWKKSDWDDDYHVYELDLQSHQIRQLTDGLGVADFEGVYLPDNNILFSSTRCIQTVDCNWTEVSNLYLMDSAGRYMRRVGFDQVHTVFPTVTDDGRVFYTRWDYNDRAEIYTQPLFQMNPDGTNQRELYGGNSWFPTNIIHARKIPGSRKILAVVTGHHRAAHGKLAIIDPGHGRQEEHGVQLIAPIRETKPIRVDKYALQGNQFQYPYPLDEHRFLVTLCMPTPKGQLGRFNIYFMDRDGNRELLVEGQDTGEGIGCKQIIPLATREMPIVRSSIVDYRKRQGTFYLQDVYRGLGLQGVARGTIRRLRVVALQFRAAGIGKLKQNGAGGNSLVSTPVSIGNGSWDVKVVLGSTPVHEDGSAFFQVPARTPVYFQALDQQDQVVQTMRSWTTLMPGENQTCVGCHEHKNNGPLAELPASMALQSGPARLKPFHETVRGFSFAEQIQPILDRHCTSCHDGDNDVPYDLTGYPVTMVGMKRRLTASYLALTHAKGSNGDHSHELVNWIDCMSGPGILPPYHRGSAQSRLLRLLDTGHEGVSLTRSERERLACWIDLLVPFCGEYTEANTWNRTEREQYDQLQRKRELLIDEERRNIDALIRQGHRHSPSAATLR